MKKTKSVLVATYIDCLGQETQIKIVIRRAQGRHLTVDASIMAMIGAFRGETIIINRRAYRIAKIAHDGYLAGVTHLDLVRLVKAHAETQESDSRAVRQQPLSHNEPSHCP
jgi:hypothetical protein